MDWIGILGTVLGSSAAVGILSALLTHRLAVRKADASSETKMRDELRTLLREERAEVHACEEKVEKLQATMIENRIEAVRWQTRCEVVEKQLTEIRTAILREYVAKGSSLPPSAPAE